MCCRSYYVSRIFTKLGKITLVFNTGRLAEAKKLLASAIENHNIQDIINIETEKTKKELVEGYLDEKKNYVPAVIMATPHVNGTKQFFDLELV